MEAAAGPHDLGPGDRDIEDPLLEEQHDSDTDPDIVSDTFDDDWDDRSSVTSVDSDSDDVIHNTTSVRSFPYRPLLFPSLICPLQDERDDFDVIADYIFQASRKCGVTNMKALLIFPC